MFLVTVHPVRRFIAVVFLAFYYREFAHHTDKVDQVLGYSCLIIAILIVVDTARWLLAWVRAYVAGPGRF